MGCATGIVKYFVFLANLVFALAGLALIIIGVLYKLNYSEVTKVLPPDFGLAPILSIIIGAIVFITAFFGCCGAVKESPCMLTSYAIILLVIFIIQVAIGVYAFLQIKDSHKFREIINTNVQNTFNSAKQYNPEANETMQLTQRWLHCCGVNGPDDYYGAQSLPSSCCINNQSPCYKAQYDKVNSEGCTSALVSFLQNSTTIIAGVAIGIAATEIIGAIFGLCLSSSIRNHYRRNIYA